MSQAQDTIAHRAQALANKHGINTHSEWAAGLAQAITCLADDEVEQDDTQRLLIELRQAGQLDATTFGQWLHQHLVETR